jgi:hypothetical protein
MRRKSTTKTRQRKKSTSRISKARLEAMVEEAIVDCCNESEQVTGLSTMIEEHLAVPFETTILGAPVTVERVDVNHRDQIVAICARGPERQAIPILDLPLPSPRPAGAEWIEAYRHWLGEG